MRMSLIYRVSQQIRKSILPPFSQEQRIHWLLVVLFLLINALLFYNVLLHDPRIGYDSTDHLDYIETLSHGKLPDQADTREFFSPPVPYILGALARAGAGISTFKAARLSQVVNGLLSAGLLFVLLKTCLLISPKPSLRIGTLLALGILPVYYRSFAMVRGEPYLAFFAVLVLYQVMKILLRKEWGWKQMLTLGVLLGLSSLSRQWGFFLYPAVGLMLAWEFLRRTTERGVIARGILAVFLCAGLLSALFYGSLYLRYGSITAFNRSSANGFSFSNQPASFYRTINLPLLFQAPVRPNLPNQLWPILYSDTWGDYWEYFLIYGRDTRASGYISGMKLIENLQVGQQEGWLDTNFQPFAGYLGRVNLVALFPTLLLACSMIFSLYRLIKTPRNENCDRKILVFSILMVLSTMVGYGWFLIQYPNDRGDTIKATYILQIYPFLALVLGNWLAWVEGKNKVVFALLLTGLGLVALHNLPAMLTHYILF